MNTTIVFPYNEQNNNTFFTTHTYELMELFVNCTTVKNAFIRYYQQYINIKTKLIILDTFTYTYK